MATISLDLPQLGQRWSLLALRIRKLRVQRRSAICSTSHSDRVVLSGPGAEQQEGTGCGAGAGHGRAGPTP